MKKLRYFHLLAAFISTGVFSFSLLSMDKYKLVSFRTDDGIVKIEKKNIPLIGALYERYDLFQKSIFKNDPHVIIPLLKGVTTRRVYLINAALNARPDTFKDYFQQLKEDDQNELMELFPVYPCAGQKVVLHVPEITKKLIAACLPADIFNKIVSLMQVPGDKEYLVNFCLRRCIQDQILWGTKKEYSEKAASLLSWDSCFFGGPFAHNLSLQASLYWLKN
jgi:hypothetical protein